MDQDALRTEGIRYHDSRQYDKAYPILFKLAKKGDVEARFRVGQMAYFGQPSEKNPKLAFQMLQEAALELHPGAMYWLGRLYEEGFGVACDYAKAVEYYSAAGAKGQEDAIVRTAEIYDQGLLGERKRATALELFVELAKKNHPYATYMIGMAYLNGDGVQKSAEHAFSWLNKALANGSVDAMNRFRLLGTKSKTDARTKDDIFAIGKSLYESNKPRQAAVYLEISAQEGVLEGYLLLADLALQGEGARRNPKRACELLEKAAAFDHPEAVFRLAKHIEEGDGAPSSAVRAAELYERAAQLGHPLAGRELALLRGY